MGIFSAIGSFCSSIVSGLSSVGSALSSVFSSAVSSLGPVGSTIASALGIVGGFLSNPIVLGISLAAKIFGLFNSKPDMEEEGLKMMEGKKRGINPENYQTFKEYQKEIDSIEINLDDYSELEKKAASIIGSSIIADFIKKEHGFSLTPETSFMLGKMDSKLGESLDKEKVSKLNESLKEKNLNLEDISNYVEGNLELKDSIKFEDSIKDVYSKLGENISVSEISKSFKEEGSI